MTTGLVGRDIQPASQRMPAAQEEFPPHRVQAHIAQEPACHMLVVGPQVDASGMQLAGQGIGAGGALQLLAWHADAQAGDFADNLGHYADAVLPELLWIIDADLPAFQGEQYDPG